jgi:hypothetical protein
LVVVDMLVPTTLTVTDVESPFVSAGALAGVPTVVTEVVGATPLFTWPTMTAPLWPMTLLRDGVVGEKESSPPHEIAKAAEMTRSRPRSGVLFIESSGTRLVRNTCARDGSVDYLV